MFWLLASMAITLLLLAGVIIYFSCSISDVTVLPEKIEPKAVEKPGLEVKFKVGEQLPWKGIWFEISEMERDRLMLKPIGMTWQRYKHLQERPAV